MDRIYTGNNSLCRTITLLNPPQYSLVFLPALLVGRLFDLGYHKIPLVCASALFILATFLTAQCTQYWHFLLCQGFAIGVSFFLTSGALIIKSDSFRVERSLDPLRQRYPTGFRNVWGRLWVWPQLGAVSGEPYFR
jgi:MFS family permease